MFGGDGGTGSAGDADYGAEGAAGAGNNKCNAGVAEGIVGDVSTDCFV